MALTHVAQTFNADPFLRVTQYDTVAKTAEITTLDPLIVARPSVVKFTKDQGGLLVVTDRVAAGVKVMDASPATTRLVMSKNGKVLAEECGSSGINLYVFVGTGFKKVNTLVAPDYEIVGIGELGDYVVLYKSGVSCKIFKRFASSFVEDHEFTTGSSGGGIVSHAFLAKDVILYRTTASGNIRQKTVYGYADSALYTAGASISLIPTDNWCYKSGSGEVVVGLTQGTGGNLPYLLSFKRQVGGTYLHVSSAVLDSSRTHFGKPVINTTEDRVLQISVLSGTTMKVLQYLLGTGGALTASTILTATSNNWTSGFSGFLEVPPVNPNNRIILVCNGTIKALPWSGSSYSIPSPGSAVSPADAKAFVAWTHSDASGSQMAVKVGSTIVPWGMTQASDTVSTTSQEFDAYDPDFPIAGGSGLTGFAASSDGVVVGYVHNGLGSATLYAGTADSVSPLGTYISYYERTAADWELAGLGEHPAGYSVKNVAFRGVDGSAVSYFLTNGPDDAIEGRYVYDGSDGSDRIFELTGQVVDAALTNTFLEYGWDDYFVATYDYSDARPSTMKLYQFGSLAMDFSEKDSIDIVFGPVTLTNCWDIIVANGPLANPFTLYKRDGDEIVTQEPLSIEWFEHYGTIVDMVSLDDCTGFIVVTDENIVIVVDIPPVEEGEERPESEIVDIIELFPPIDEELVDPAEPPPEEEQPEEPPEEIELDPITGQLVVTYPPNPQGPAPGQEGEPGQPSAPVYPPIPVPIGNPAAYPPGTVIPPPPGIPNPPQLVTNPIEGGGSLTLIARTARVSLNIAYER